MITTSRETDYVLNRVEGHVTLRELLEYAHRGVNTWLTDAVLWDLTNATMTHDETDYAAVRAVIGNIHGLVEMRKGRKTVFVASDPCSYGMLRMAITIVECCESRLVASVFADIGSAEAWLKEPDLTADQQES